MSETVPTNREQINTPEQERKAELLKKIRALSEFARANPGSPDVKKIAEILHGVLPTPLPALERQAPEDPKELPVLMDQPEQRPIPGRAPRVDRPLVADSSAMAPERVSRIHETFEQAEHAERPFSDEFIGSVVGNNLQKPGGRRESFLKGFFDNVPPDESDTEFVHNHAEAIAFRDELTDFMIRELKILAPEDMKEELAESRLGFNETLELNKRAFREYVSGRERKLDLKENRVPSSAMDFRALLFSDGESIKDLLDDKVEDVYPNLYVQSEMGQRFIHWSSDGFIDKKSGGNRPALTRRIYLNPRPQDTVKVFSDVIHAIQDADLTVKAKVYDRTSDSDVMASYDRMADTPNMRGDTIVVYATEEEAERVLGLVEEQYQQHSEAFEGRGLSSIPYEIAPGMGIGDEPSSTGESLTSHRHKVIVGVLDEVRDAKIVDGSERIAYFRRLWNEAATREGINPENPAFNTRRSS